MKAVIVIEIDENHLLKETNELYDRLKGYKCDLRPLPQMKVGDDLYERYGSWTPSDEKEVYYRVGFNDCLEEIMGETE